MKHPLLVFGAGGHARVVVSIARHDSRWEIAGVLDRDERTRGEGVGGAAIVGPFAEAPQQFSRGVRHVALALGDNAERAQWLAELERLGFDFPTLQHPRSVVEESVSIGRGTLVCAGAILGAEARIGEAVIINTGAIVDHESQIGDYAHIAPGCRLAGRVRIGRGAFIGIGSTVRDKVSVGDDTIVGAGSVVVTDLPGSVVAFGCPARIQRPRP